MGSRKLLCLEGVRPDCCRHLALSILLKEHTGQIVAALEGSGANVLDRVGDRDLLQRTVVDKGLLTDRLYMVGPDIGREGQGLYRTAVKLCIQQRIIVVHLIGDSICLVFSLLLCQFIYFPVIILEGNLIRRTGRMQLGVIVCNQIKFLCHTCFESIPVKVTGGGFHKVETIITALDPRKAAAALKGAQLHRLIEAVREA